MITHQQFGVSIFQTHPESKDVQALNNTKHEWEQKLKSLSGL